MTSIVQTFIGDNRLQLGCEEYARPFSFGTNWTKIRIALRLAPYNTYSNLSYPAGPFVGISQGYGGLLSTATDYVGVSLNWTSTIHLSYNLSGTANSYMSNGASGLAILRKVGNIITTTVSGGVSYNLANRPNSCMGQLMVEFQKISATAITISMFSPSTVDAVVGISRDAFQTQLEMATPTNCTLGVGGPTTFAIGSNMLWDTVNVAWQKTVPTLEIADLVVVRQL